MGRLQVEQLEQSLWSLKQSKSSVERDLRLARQELINSHSYIDHLKEEYEALQEQLERAQQEVSADSTDELSDELQRMSTEAGSLREEILQQAKSVPEGLPTPLRQAAAASKAEGSPRAAAAPRRHRHVATEAVPAQLEGAFAAWSPSNSRGRVPPAILLPPLGGAGAPLPASLLQERIGTIKAMFDEACNELKSGDTPSGTSGEPAASPGPQPSASQDEFYSRIGQLRTSLSEVLEMVSLQVNASLQPSDSETERSDYAFSVARAVEHELGQQLKLKQTQCVEMEHEEDRLRLLQHTCEPEETEDVARRLQEVQQLKQEAYSEVDQLLWRQAMATSECDRFQPSLLVEDSPQAPGSEAEGSSQAANAGLPESPTAGGGQPHHPPGSGGLPADPGSPPGGGCPAVESALDPAFQQRCRDSEAILALLDGWSVPQQR